MKKSSTWRDHCKPIIAEIISRNLPEKEEKRMLRNAYPYGERKRWPYKIWLDEIKRQKGELPPLRTKRNIIDPAQLQMDFDLEEDQMLNGL